MSELRGEMFHVIAKNLRSVPRSELFFFAVLSSWIANGPDGAIEDTSRDEAKEILETLFLEIISCCPLPTTQGERVSDYRNLYAAGNPWRAPLQGGPGRTADRRSHAGNARRAPPTGEPGRIAHRRILASNASHRREMSLSRSRGRDDRRQSDY